MSLYNSIPYDEYEMSKIKFIIETRIDDTCNINTICINDVIDAVIHTNLMAMKVYIRIIVFMVLINCMRF